MKNQVSLVYFSPGGSTKKVAETFISALDCDVKRTDLLKQELVQDLQDGFRLCALIGFNS